MKKTATLTIQLTPNLRSELNDYAHHSERSLSSIVRLALKEHLANANQATE